jgi:hypothetical protein
MEFIIKKFKDILGIFQIFAKVSPLLGGAGVGTK